MRSDILPNTATEIPDTITTNYPKNAGVATTASIASKNRKTSNHFSFTHTTKQSMAALAKVLQASPQWQNIPVIVVSGFASTDEQHRALNLRIRRYLIKPMSLKTLLQVIQEEI